jgi:hypothetical protein
MQLRTQQYIPEDSDLQRERSIFWNSVRREVKHVIDKGKTFVFLIVFDKGKTFVFLIVFDKGKTFVFLIVVTIFVEQSLF